MTAISKSKQKQLCIGFLSHGKEGKKNCHFSFITKFL